MVLVVIMLLTLSVGGISSLSTYSGVTRELSDSLADRTLPRADAGSIIELNEFLPGLTEEGRWGKVSGKKRPRRGIVWGENCPTT